MAASTPLILGKQRLELLPDRAAFWPAESTLLVADLHLGKDAVFRRQGLAVPGGVLAADLAWLDTLIGRTTAKRLIVLGDLVHAPPEAGDDWPGQLARWRRGHAELIIDLVLGNHDRALHDWLRHWRITGHEDTLELAGLSLTHEWGAAAARPGVSGHLHPGVEVRGGGDRLRLPAFLLGDQHLVLPAFGRFTGLMESTAFPAERRFAVAHDQVIEVF